MSFNWEDICAREYVINKLTEDKFRTFVDFLYDDIRTWDNPTEVSDNDVMSYAMYPKVAKDFLKFKSQYGPVDKLETR